MQAEGRLAELERSTGVVFQRIWSVGEGAPEVGAPRASGAAGAGGVGLAKAGESAEARAQRAKRTENIMVLERMARSGAQPRTLLCAHAAAERDAPCSYMQSGSSLVHQLLVF